MRRIIVNFVLLIIVVVIVGGSVAWWMVQSPAASAVPKMFEIQTGQGVNEISQNLHEQGLIRSKLAFETLLWAMKAEGKLKAGSYTLSPNQDVFTVIDVLMQGQQQRNRLTFIEGWTLDDYQALLKTKNFDITRWVELTGTPSAWIERYPFLNSIPDGQGLEGYLFPDTYIISNGSLESLITKMLDTFNRRVPASMRADIAQQNKKLHEVLTMASIIEKEVPESEDRKIVADIFFRRLELGMPLQSDATVNYITRSGRTQSNADDLAIDSPYNTYKYKGLPPGPIGNPSLDAIQATLSPSPNTYLYFLTGRDGVVRYARTFEEHKQNRVKYLD